MKKAIVLGVTVVLGSTSSFANAALPANVTTDMASAATDAATLGGIVLGLIVGIAAFKHIRAAK